MYDEELTERELILKRMRDTYNALLAYDPRVERCPKPRDMLEVLFDPEGSYGEDIRRYHITEEEFELFLARELAKWLKNPPPPPKDPTPN